MQFGKISVFLSCYVTFKSSRVFGDLLKIEGI